MIFFALAVAYVFMFAMAIGIVQETDVVRELELSKDGKIFVYVLLGMGWPIVVTAALGYGLWVGIPALGRGVLSLGRGARDVTLHLSPHFSSRFARRPRLPEARVVERRDG